MINNAINNKLREQYNPDNSDLRKFQLRLLLILDFIDGVCKEHNIKYCLSSGTLLGAYRHGGYIPWDDDIDIEMQIEDYNRFISVMRKSDNKDFVMQDYANDIYYLNRFCKIRDMHSCVSEDQSWSKKYKYQGCFVDVFPIGPGTYKGRQIANFIYYHLLERPAEKGYGKLYFSIIKKLVFNLLYPTIDFFSKLFYNRKYYNHLAGSLWFKKRIVSTLFPFGTIEFEGKTYPSPNNVEAYLSSVYGDSYNEIPEHKQIHLSDFYFVDEDDNR